MKMAWSSSLSPDIAKVSTFQSATDGVEICYTKLQHKMNNKNKNDDARVTIVFLTGWKETFFRYEDLFQEMYFDKGFNVFSMDHRSQGVSEDDPGMALTKGNSDGSGRRICYVNDFETSYLADAQQFLETIVHPAIHSNNNDQQPTKSKSSICVVGRSMGGAIATRLCQTCPHLFDRCVVMVPMYSHKNVFDVAGLLDLELPIGVGRVFANAMTGIGLGKVKADGRDTNAAVPTTELLSHSEERIGAWNEMRKSNPSLVLAGASFGWVKAAFQFEQTVMTNAHTIQTPMLLFQAENDSFVYNSAHDEFVTRANQNKELVRLVGPIQDSYHEELMEQDEIRDPILRVIYEFAALGSNVEPPFPKSIQSSLEAIPVVNKGVDEDDGCRWPSGHHSGVRPPSLPMPLVFRGSAKTRKGLDALIKGVFLALVVQYGLSMFRKR